MVASVDPKRLPDTPYPKIEDHGVIGNLHTVALVSLNGCINLMCVPRFDSPTVFAKLLDTKKGGHFSLSPELEDVNYKQLYLPDTNILLTRILSDAGMAEITDFMPVKAYEENCVLVRRLTMIKGKMKFRMECQPRFDYARKNSKVSLEKGRVKFQPEDESACLQLLCNHEMQIDEYGAYLEFTLHEKEQVDFILEDITESAAEDIDSVGEYVVKQLKVTIKFWKTWIRKTHYTGRWQEIVNRSTLVLKGLMSYQFGSMVAAPTFSLPEKIGGSLNWDYRFCWIRDTCMTMNVMLKLGFDQEAHGFMDWIKGRVDELDGDGQLQLIYDLDGSRESKKLKEEELDYLEGYRGSKPVRIGNAARKQFQMDIYGELLHFIYEYNRRDYLITYQFWQQVEKLVEFICKNWQKPDQSIWEIREQKKEYLFSRLMNWVGLDRAIRLAEERSFPADLNRWRKTRDKIYTNIFEEFWNEEKAAFVQYKGSNSVDAVSLLMPLLGFVSPQEPRWQKTFERVEKELVSESLVYRYKNGDTDEEEIYQREGSFSICTFWYVECLSRMDRVEDARLHFEKMLGYANHLGLYTEQIGLNGDHLGNFPQAFTHLGLINAAMEINAKIAHHGLEK